MVPEKARAAIQQSFWVRAGILATIALIVLLLLMPAELRWQAFHTTSFYLLPPLVIGSIAGLACLQPQTMDHMDAMFCRRHGTCYLADPETY
jgi:hypothetical protein